MPSSLRIAHNFASRLRRGNVPFVLLSSCVPSLHPLSFCKRSSFYSNFFTTGVLVVLTNGRGRIVLVERAGSNRIIDGRRSGHRIKFHRCVRSRFPRVIVGILSLPLGKAHGRCRGVLNRCFSRRPTARRYVAVASGTRVIKSCLLGSGHHSMRVVNCSVINGGTGYLHRNDVSFLVTRRTCVRNCCYISALFHTVILGGGIGPMGCVPVRLLVGRGVSFCHEARVWTHGRCGNCHRVSVFGGKMALWWLGGGRRWWREVINIITVIFISYPRHNVRHLFNEYRSWKCRFITRHNVCSLRCLYRYSF